MTERRTAIRNIVFSIAAAAVLIALTVHAFISTGILDWESGDVAGNTARIITEMVPPKVTNPLELFASVLEIFQMCVTGVLLGGLISIPLGILSARSLTPHPFLYHASRLLIAFFRSVPDMVWAIWFVIITGLGPLAGMYTLLVDTIGFAGRFFAEAMDRVDKRPVEALSAAGASFTGRFFSVIVYWTAFHRLQTRFSFAWSAQ